MTRDDDWDAIVAKLPEGWRELASLHGVLKSKSPAASALASGWKVRDPSVLLRMILHYACTNSALKTTAGTAAATGLVEISAVALHKWMRKSGHWIASMVCAMVATAAKFDAARWAGYDVIAVDATTAQNPGAKGTTARIHFALRLVDLRAVAILVGGAEIGETLKNFVIEAKQLWIADRGYCNANSIAHAVAAHAAVLIRFAFGPLPLFDTSGASVDVRAWLRGVTTPGEIREYPVQVRPRGHDAIDCRLIIMRLLPDQAARACKRLYEEHTKSEVTPAMLELTNYVVLITTVPINRLSAEELIELYRLRWQIELNFKREKTIAGLEKIPTRLPETIYCWICAKYLGIELARRLAEPAGPFPPVSSGVTPSASVSPRSPPRPPGFIREIWRCTVLLWNTFRAALMPLRICQLPEALPRFVAHIARSNEKSRERAVDRFCALIREKVG